MLGQPVDNFYRMAVEDGEVPDFVDEMEEENYGAGGEAMELNEYEMLTRVTDISSAHARAGKDIQGIPWERLNITREEYRLTRLEQYKNYENIPSSGEAVDKECKQMEKGGNYYEFFHNTRLVKPTILHFQLRNLVWATSKHDVYLMSNYSIMHWSSLSCNLSEVINFAGHVAPVEKHPGSLLEGFTQTQISTLAVKDNFLVAGGFQGELTCKRLDKQGVSFCARTTYDDNAITNAIEIYDSLRGGVHFMASNNDSGLREYDMERFQILNHFRYPWPVNVSALKLCNLTSMLSLPFLVFFSSFLPHRVSEPGKREIKEEEGVHWFMFSLLDNDSRAQDPPSGQGRGHAGIMQTLPHIIYLQLFAGIKPLTSRLYP